MASSQKKTVLITGCTTGGIGWAQAKAFQQRGFHVFATARDVSAAADLTKIPNIELLELDVTIQDSINRCQNLVAERTNGKLDVLVNNAGIESQSPLLDVNIDTAKELYEVNVWGPLRVTQAFAPLLIESKGIIVNQSSIDAALNMVWAGIYASSKAALARMSETLRLELEPLGVRIVTVMCGSVDTPMFTKPSGRMSLPETSYYRNAQDTAYKERMDHRSKASNVDELAKQVVDKVLGGANGPLWLGAMATMTRYATWAFPTWLMDRMVNAERGIGLVKRR